MNKTPMRAMFEYKNMVKFKDLMERKIWWGGRGFEVILDGRPATTETAAELFNARYPGAEVQPSDFFGEPFISMALERSRKTA